MARLCRPAMLSLACAPVLPTIDGGVCVIVEVGAGSVFAVDAGAAGGAAAVEGAGGAAVGAAAGAAGAANCGGTGFDAANVCVGVMSAFGTGLTDSLRGFGSAEVSILVFGAGVGPLSPPMRST